MEFVKFHKEAKISLDNKIKEDTEAFISGCEVIAPKLKKHLGYFAETMEGGKRLRGTLVMLGNRIAGGENAGEALKAAVVYEIMQSAILIHDDVIDQSGYRRGKKTIHKQLGDNHYAVSQAICLGDIGFFWSIQKLNAIDLPEKQKIRLIDYFLIAKTNTILGEMLDVDLPERDSLSEDDLAEMFYLKTAIYTIIAPLQLGAIIAGASQELLVEMEKIGKYLGWVFQIKDDIIGIFQSGDISGKSSVTDIEEGKITHMYLYALKEGGEDALNTLNRIYGSKDVTPEGLKEIQHVFRSTGALDYVTSLMHEYAEKAKELISQSILSDRYKKVLFEFCDYLTGRAY